MSWMAMVLLAGCPKAPVPIETPQPDGGSTPDVVTAPVDTSRPVLERVNEAADRIAAGTPSDLAQAIALLETAADEDPTGVARYNLALAWFERGDPVRARSEAQAAVAASPANGDAWLLLGFLAERDGDLKGALSNYSTGVENDPENIGLRVAIIGALRKNGQPNEAIAAAKEALKVNSKAMGVYNNFGLACLDTNNLVLAKFVFQKAIQEIDGAEQDPALQTNLGWTYYLDDNVPEATDHLQKALALDPNLIPALVYLSRVYMDDHNYADTVPLLETAARLDPNNADIQLTLGVAYRGVGRLDDAEKAYAKALTLAPSDPAPYFNRGVLLGDYRKDYPGAIAAFDAYIAARGPEAALAQTYIKDVNKERELSEKRAKAEAERKAKEEERKRKEALIQQAPPDAPAPDAPAPDAPAPDAPAPDAPAPDAPAPEPAPQ